MFNVLPENFKETIRTQYKKRRLIVWMIALISLELVFLASLLPSYAYLLSEERNLTAENSSETGKQIQDSNGKTELVLQNVNKELSVLSPGLSSTDPNTIIARALSIKGDLVTFTEITYHTETATTSLVIISGVASTREALLSLSKRFEADEVFQNVDLPVSNFAKDNNIDFSMRMEAKI